MPDPKPREQHVLDAERIIADCPTALQKWLDAEKLKASDAEGPIHNATWEGSLRARGLLEAANLWLKMQKTRLTEEFPVTGHTRTAREIAWRYAKAKMMQETGGMKKKPKAKPVSDEAQASLPPDLRWVYNHPSLDEAAEAAGVIQIAAVEKYEKQNPCPSQGAKNYLSRCLRDDSVSKAMFAKVDTYLLQSMRIKKEAVVSEVDQTEKRRILDMRRELATIPAKSPR
jgi:hypothetical protein